MKLNAAVIVIIIASSAGLSRSAPITGPAEISKAASGAPFEGYKPSATSSADGSEAAVVALNAMAQVPNRRAAHLSNPDKPGMRGGDKSSELIRRPPKKEEESVSFWERIDDWTRENDTRWSITVILGNVAIGAALGALCVVAGSSIGIGITVVGAFLLNGIANIMS